METKKITIESIDKMHLVSVEEIVYCQTDSPYLTVCLTNGLRLMECKTLKLWKESVADVPFLIQISQSVVVNVKYIKAVHYESRNVEMEDGTHLRYTIKKSEIKELIKAALAVKADDESGFLKKQAK